MLSLRIRVIRFALRPENSNCFFDGATHRNLPFHSIFQRKPHVLSLFKTPQSDPHSLRQLRRMRAVDEDWTHDLFLTKEVLYHWATTACYFLLSQPISCSTPPLPHGSVGQALSYNSLLLSAIATNFVLYSAFASRLRRTGTELQQLLALSFWLLANSERETRFELATYSLEGYRSTNWATPADIHRSFGEGGCYSFNSAFHPNWRWSPSLKLWRSQWGEQDSNLWRHKSTDLQSVLVGRLSISPIFFTHRYTSASSVWNCILLFPRTSCFSKAFHDPFQSFF